MLSLVIKSNRTLVDASGRTMDLLGEVSLPIKLLGLQETRTHTFSVLDIPSPKNIIMGRDFLSLYGEVTFDFNHHKIRLHHTWLNTVQIPTNSFVKIANNQILEPRSEAVIVVKCKEGMSGMPLDFIPFRSNKIPNLHVSHCRIIPDSNITEYLQLKY